MMSELLKVKLEDNRLSGEIPGELAVLSDLRVLWLDDNDLEGPVPNDLARLSRLLSFNAEDNHTNAAPRRRKSAVDWRVAPGQPGGPGSGLVRVLREGPVRRLRVGGTKVGTPCASVTEKHRALRQGVRPVRWHRRRSTRADAEWTRRAREKSPPLFRNVDFRNVPTPRFSWTCLSRARRAATTRQRVRRRADHGAVRVGSPDACSFRQCVPVRPGTAENREDSRKPKTAVPAAVLAEWRADVARKRGGGGLGARVRAGVGAVRRDGRVRGARGAGQGAAPCVRAWMSGTRRATSPGCAPFGGSAAASADGAATPVRRLKSAAAPARRCAVLSDGYHECVPFDELKRRGMDAWPRDPVSGKLRRAETSGDFFLTDERRAGAWSRASSAAAPSRRRRRKPAFLDGVVLRAGRGCVRKTGGTPRARRARGRTASATAPSSRAGSCVSEGDACVFVDEYFAVPPDSDEPTMRRETTPLLNAVPRDAFFSPRRERRVSSDDRISRRDVVVSHNTNVPCHISYFSVFHPLGRLRAVVLAPISAQLVESTVPPLSWKLLFIARRVSSSALP